MGIYIYIYIYIYIEGSPTFVNPHKDALHSFDTKRDCYVQLSAYGSVSQFTGGRQTAKRVKGEAKAKRLKTRKQGSSQGGGRSEAVWGPDRGCKRACRKATRIAPNGVVDAGEFQRNSGPLLWTILPIESDQESSWRESGCFGETAAVTGSSTWSPVLCSG